jgi:hypothetical protein
MKSFNRALMGVASAMTLAAAAYAQPTPNADAGTIAPCNIATGTLTSTPTAGR